MPQIDLSPAFVRLAAHLRSKIVGGEWMPGQLVPGEAALALEFRISVGTVRKAMDTLVGQGLVTRHRGRGTFVARATDERSFTSFFKLVNRTHRERELPRDETLYRKRVAANATERRELGLAEGDFVYRIGRRRMLAETPAVLETISLPASIVGQAEWGEQEGSLHPIYSFLERQCGVSVSHVEDRIRSSQPTKQTAEEFGLGSGESVLEVVRLAYDLKGVPVELRRSWMRTALHDYVVRLDWKGAA